MIGVNFFGDLNGEGSLSEVARTTLDTIARRGIAFTYNELLYPYDMYREGIRPDPRYEGLPCGSIYAANLFCYNMHLFGTITPERLADLTQGKRTMVSWVWEMPDVPEVWQPQFARVDEIWVPSRFVQVSFEKVTANPVIVVPHPIDVRPSADATRASFGLPEDRTIFLFSFSAGSGDGRKNPWDVIEAYRRAFGKSSAADKPLLLIKVQHSAHYPDITAALAAELDAVGGRLISEPFPRQRVHDLYFCVDAFISLHRAEGFGLGMAEAMCAGVPVIATAYSGNLDFMTPDNGYFVDYRLRPVTVDDHRFRPDLIDYYRPGMIWAEPDVDQAAEYMQAVYEHPDEARERGRRAAETIARDFSPDAVGAIMEARIRAAVTA